MKITKAWVDAVAPKHGRTSCNDEDLSNALGGWNGKYNRDTGKKEIEYPRCTRCYLLNHLGQNVDDLEFAVETSLWWKGE